MPVTLLIGAPNTGKTGAAYSKLRDAIEAGESPALLLPSRPDVERARAEFAASHPVGLTISSFDAYLSEAWLTHGDGRRLVTGAQRDALVAAVLGDAGGEALSALRGRPGAVELLARLARRSAGCAGVPGRLGGDAGELVAAVLAYRRLLAEGGLVEPGEAYGLLAEDPTSDHDPVVVHRFASLAPHQEAYLAALSARGVSVFVTLTHNGPATARPAISGLERLSREPAVVLAEPDERTKSEDLRLLASHLFDPPAEPLPSPADVTFVFARDADDAIERAAEEAARAVSCGSPPERVAVVYRDPWPKARGLRRALADRGLPLDADIEVPLRALPLARAVIHVMRFQLGGSRSELLAWLRSPFSGVTPVDAERLEAVWRRSREQRPAALAAAVQRASAAADAILGLSRRLAAEPVDEEWAKRWTMLVQAALSSAHPGDSPSLPSSAEEDAQAARALVGIAGEVAGSIGVTVACPDVLAAIEAAGVGPGRVERRGRVQLVSAERARSRRFSTVILGGLTADEFPRQGWDEPLGAGAAGEASRALGIPPESPGLVEERALFVDLVTRARERLVLLSHAAGDDGEVCAPSPFWSEALDLYRSREDEDAEGLPALVETTAEDTRPPGAWATPRRLSQRLAQRDGRAAEALARREVFSAGELESYLACPARWFRDRMLRPESPDAEFAALESGRIVHSVLRRTLERLAEAGAPRVTRASLSEALRIAEEAFAEESTRLPEPVGIEEEDRRETAWAQVEAFLRREPAFLPRMSPVELEADFGFAADDVVDLGGFRIRGRVDRVDSDGSSALVIDYKTGGIRPFGEFEKRGLLQLPLYAEVFRRRGRQVVGAIYRSLKTGTSSGFYLADAFEPGELVGCTAIDAEGFESVLDDAIGRARLAVAGIRAAEFRPAPAADVCRFCSMAPSCERSAA